MKFKALKYLSEIEKKEVFRLWNNEYPEKLAYKSVDEFDDYLKNLTNQSHVLLEDNNGIVRGWYFDFIRNGEKWFAIILDSTLQGKGLGTKLLNRAKEKEDELNGWVIDHNNDRKQNGEFYKSPLGFYLKNDFEELKNERLELEKISAVKIRWKR
ncbi:GNAT family N-acetyltransferase [Halocola ammonii]